MTHRALQDGKSGLSDSLRKLSIVETEHPDYWTTQVPEYFDSMDVRKKPELYIEDRLLDVIGEAFEYRRKVEKNMSRRELVAFDKVLRKYLEPDTLLRRLERAVDQDFAFTIQNRQLHEQFKQMETSLEDQMKKTPNNQRDFNNSIQNEEALYKQLAFGAMTEQKYKTQVENPD